MAGFAVTLEVDLLRTVVDLETDESNLMLFLERIPVTGIPTEDVFALVETVASKLTTLSLVDCLLSVAGESEEFAAHLAGWIDRGQGNKSAEFVQFREAVISGEKASDAAVRILLERAARVRKGT